MTGTASSKGLSVLDFDIHRNQEWLRRRKLRLEQVRKQSNEIAKAIREKVINEERARLDAYDRMSEEKFKDWKAERLEELERKFRTALEEFGKSHKLAESEPDPEEIIKERHKMNLEKAQKRGEIAKQEELKRKKIAEGQKMSLIQRKKLIRKKEDIRAALIHSLPVKNQIIHTERAFEEKVSPENITFSPTKKKITNHKEQIIPDVQKKVSKVSVNKEKKRKKVTPQKSCMCKYRAKNSQLHNIKGSETTWINLNEIQSSSTGDSGLHPNSSKSSGMSEKIQREKPERMIEFYDFSSRYYCKSFREFPHSVERIDTESEMVNANVLAKIEDEAEKLEAKKKMEADAISQERGMEALRREKISQDYNDLMIKLEKLRRKEKILKVQQQNLPSFLHMTDERLAEKMRNKQRLMNAKFESIYHEAISQIPRTEPPRPKPFCCRGGGDFTEVEEMLTRLSFSPTLKYNTPVTSDGESSADSSPEGIVHRAKKSKKKKRLLLDIDKALREGRELRKVISVNRGTASLNQEEERGNLTSDLEEMQQASTAEISPAKDGGRTMTKSQESQTEDFKGVEVSTGAEVLKDFSKTGDDSLPMSTSTSYKSPPSVIRSYRLRQFLEYLDGVSELEFNGVVRNSSKSDGKIDKILQDLLPEDSNNTFKKDAKLSPCPTLEYYIEKLLNMSRECIADLSVSSENVSTPTITDLDIKDPKDSEPEHCSQISSKGEDFIRKSRLERADQLEETIRNWKRILEKNSKEVPELEDVPDCPRPEVVRLEELSEEKPEESVHLIYRTKINSKYEEITKKCSERISELSHMLDKVRKDKEKLLGSTSGGSSLSLNNGRTSEKDEEEEEGEHIEDEKVGRVEDEEGDQVEDEKEEHVEEQELVSMEGLEESPRTSLVESFLNRYNLSKPRKETVSTTAVADSQSFQNLEESLESWPDVMEELIKRKILTSPFKWSDEEHSSELTAVTDSQTKPSSIETVIGNFRKEISKIKPLTLSDSFAKSHSFDERHQELFCNSSKRALPRWDTSERGQVFQEESSVESINQALTNLGLNWAKSFLRKNEESRAISSSSNSEGKCSGDEAGDYH